MLTLLEPLIVFYFDQYLKLRIFGIVAFLSTNGKLFYIHTLHTVSLPTSIIHFSALEPRRPKIVRKRPNPSDKRRIRARNRASSKVRAADSSPRARDADKPRSPTRAAAACPSRTYRPCLHPARAFLFRLLQLTPRNTTCKSTHSLLPIRITSSRLKNLRHTRYHILTHCQITRAQHVHATVTA